MLHRARFGLSIFAVSCALLLAISACDSGTPGDGGPTAPASGDVALESATLDSGGEGVLVSSAFDGLDLRPALDEENSIIPGRWTNFRVLVDGEEADSRRLDAQRIAFDVPVLTGGTYAIDVASPRVATSFSTRVFGVIASGLVVDCFSPQPISFTRVGGALYFGHTCLDLSLHGSRQGIARVLPNLPERAFEWVPGSDFEGTSSGFLLSWIRTGPSIRPNSFVGSRPGPNSLPPDIWVWEAVPDPIPVEALPCFDSAAVSYTLTAPAEVSEGVCLVFLPGGSGQILRNGVEVANCCRFDSDAHFVMAADGWSALRAASRVVVFDGAGQLVHLEEEEAGVVRDVRFAKTGDEMFIARAAGALQVLDRTTGEVLREATLPGPGGPFALSLSPGRLWLARTSGPTSGDGRLVVELYDPDTLERLRSIAVSPELTAFAPFWPNPGVSPLLTEDATGRRLHLTTFVGDILGTWVHAIEIE